METYDSHADNQASDDVHYRISRNRELRIRVLETAASAEFTMMSVGVPYLGSGSVKKQNVVERRIGEWGGMKAASGIAKSALTEHGQMGQEHETSFEVLKQLIDLRNIVAHGFTDRFTSNEAPADIDGTLVRELFTRSRTGRIASNPINFDQPETIVTEGEEASITLSKAVADLAR